MRSGSYTKVLILFEVYKKKKMFISYKNYVTGSIIYDTTQIKQLISDQQLFSNQNLGWTNIK